MIFGQGIPDFNMTEHILHGIRIAATVVGALVGWFVSDPLTRIGYRLSFRGPTPGWLLPWTKLSGAALLALLVYLFLPLGPGTGGLGFGPGRGGTPGAGPGPGGAKNGTTDPNLKDDKSTKDPKTITPKKVPETLESIEIEIISNKEWLKQKEGEDRFFILRRKGQNPGAPISKQALKEFFELNHAKIEVTPVMTKASIGTAQEDNPLSQLLALAKEYRVKTLQTKMPEVTAMP